MRKSVFAMLLLYSAPAPVLAQDNATTGAVEALRQAQAARAQALETLEEADVALAKAESLLAAAGQPAETPSPPAMARLASEALCIGSDCTSNSGLSDFVQTRLGITRLADYKNTTELGFHIQGGKEGNYASIGPVLSRRSLVGGEDDEYRTRVDRIAIKGFASIAEDDSITLGSWSASDGLSGNSDWAIGLDWRRSWMAPRKLSDGRSKLVEMLSAIGKDCAAALNLPHSEALFDDPRCRAWVAEDPDRRWKYYQKYIAPFWGFAEDGKERLPQFYVGAKGKYGFLKESFYALSDPAGTGSTILPMLPADLDSEALTKERFNPAEFKLYAGHALATAKDNKGWDVGIAGSIGWQRAIRYPKDSEDVSICYEDTDAGSPTLGFSKCSKVNIAAPYETDGVIIGAGFNFQPPRTWIGRPYIGAFGSYDTAVDQWTASMPVAFAVDGDGKLKAGLKFTFTSDGETFYGEKLPARGNIGVFLEHDLTFPFVP